MKDIPEISIIVAVYKAENYIRRCLDSILAQTFTDFEVLLIDDGSPDRSGEICDVYAAKDSRIRVIHKENGGVSSARQCGIDNARGKYSIHVDPDDWVEPDYLEVLHDKIVAEDADICCCYYINEYESNSIPLSKGKRLRKSKLSNADGIIKIYSTSLCNKLVRHELYKILNLRFPRTIDVGEDEYVLRELLNHNLKIVFVDNLLYHYDRIVNSQSLTKIYDDGRFLQEEKLLKLLYESEEENSSIFRRKFHVGQMAHDAFLFNYMNSLDFRKYFKGYFFDIMTSSNPIWRKINILFAFLGMGDLIRPIYIKLKSGYLNGG